MSAGTPEQGVVEWAWAGAAIEGDRSIYTAYNGVQKLRQPILEKARAYNRHGARCTYVDV